MNTSIPPVDLSVPRRYGDPPYDVAVIHGGPGAPGEMEEVAWRISQTRSVLEPFQTEDTLDGQVVELKALIDRYAGVPVTLIGFSWGALLSLILAGRYPEMVKRLILIGTPPLEEGYVQGIQESRLNRLDVNEREDLRLLLDDLGSGKTEDMDRVLRRLGLLVLKADSYDPMEGPDPVIRYQYPIFKAVWDEVSHLRRNGSLLEIVGSVRCSVFLIHGDHDPHPADGALKPLERTVNDTRSAILPRCGHRPWIERYAVEEFFRVLEDEMGDHR